MIVLDKKKILIAISSLSIFIVSAVAIGSMTIGNKTVTTSSLPVTNKVIILDAGHGIPDEGAQSSNRNN